MLTKQITPNKFNGRQHEYIAFIFSVTKPKLAELKTYLLKKKQTDYIVEPKYDGLYIQVVKQGTQVKAYSDQGNPLNLPSTIINEIKKLPPDLVVEGELESYLNGSHQPRGVTIGFMHKKGLLKENLHIVLTLFDCLYFNKDISNLSTLERLEYLKKLNLPSKITPTTVFLNRVPYIRGKTIPQILLAVKKFIRIRHFEGAILKSTSADARHLKFIKFKRYIEFALRVVKKVPTKTPGVYNYDVAAINEKGAPEVVARTHNTRLNLKIGDTVAVACFNTSVFLDENGKRVRVRLYSATIQGKINAPVNTLKTIIRTSKYYHVLEIHKIT